MLRDMAARWNVQSQGMLARLPNGTGGHGQDRFFMLAVERPDPFSAAGGCSGAGPRSTSDPRAARERCCRQHWKLYGERGEFRAKAHVTDDVPPGAVWIRDGWVGLNHLTSGDAVLTGDALNLFPFSVGQADYGARVEVARI